MANSKGPDAVCDRAGHRDCAYADRAVPLSPRRALWCLCKCHRYPAGDVRIDAPDCYSAAVRSRGAGCTILVAGGAIARRPACDSAHDFRAARGGQTGAAYRFVDRLGLHRWRYLAGIVEGKGAPARFPSRHSSLVHAGGCAGTGSAGHTRWARCRRGGRRRKSVRVAR